MRWKEVIVGAFAALVVTVLGGVIIFYWTRQPPQEQLMERLIYSIDKPQSFETEKTKTTYQTIRIGNFGSAPATNVNISVKVDSGVAIVDKNISLSSGPAGIYNVSFFSPQHLSFCIRNLTPDENVNISLKFDGIVAALPKINIKS